MTKVVCPVCSIKIEERDINRHLDSNCATPAPLVSNPTPKPKKDKGLASIFASSSQPSIPSSQASSSKRHIEEEDEEDSPLPKRIKVLPADAKGKPKADRPLAERMRPTAMDEFVGQAHLSLLLENPGAMLGSMILWGPPGSGKTSLVRLLAKTTSMRFKELSATTATVNEVRTVCEEGKKIKEMTGKSTILFLDEVQRFSKVQQEVVLGYVERGDIIFVAATTDNPSFRLVGALLSRCRVFTFERIKDEDMKIIMTNAIKRTASEMGSFTDRVLNTIVSLANGDARVALGLAEIVINIQSGTPEDKLIQSLKGSVSTSYDRTGDDRYDMISALHKCVRGSQVDASLYWLARMLTEGEDPLYIARRMVVCSSEDIGLADPKALPLAMAAMQACERIGMPECRINLAHLVCYLAKAEKDNSAYMAYTRAENMAKQTMALGVPFGVRNAPTRMMKNMGYGAAYRYNHDYAHPVTNEYLPEEVRISEGFFGKEKKIWDDDALREWEKEYNGGQKWKPS